MAELVEMLAALLLVLSPLIFPVVCFAAQVFLSEKCRPLLLLILPVLTGLLAFGWFPEHWNGMLRGFYGLAAVGAFSGSAAGAVICAAVNRKKWFKR